VRPKGAHSHNTQNLTTHLGVLYEVIWIMRITNCKLKNQLDNENYCILLSIVLSKTNF
jgi:hypothetical protein